MLGTLAVCLAGAELFARVRRIAPVVHNIQPGREKTSYRVSDNPILGYELKPNYRDIRPDSWESFEAINSHGLRDVERPIAKPPATRRLLLLGDSVVLGLGIRSISETLSQQLEQLYARDNTGERIEVLGAGLAGYCTRGEAELLRVKGVQYAPDLVALVFVENDFHDYNDNIWAYKFRRPPGTEWLFLKSHLFRALALRFDWFHFRAEVDPEYQRNWSANAVGPDNVTEGLHVIRKLADGNGFETVVLIWPRFEGRRVFYPRNLFDEDEPDRLRVETIAETIGLPTVRLDRYFYEDYMDRVRRDEVPADTPIQDVYTFDLWHPSTEGAPRVAEVLKRALRERAGFPAADPA